PHGAGRRRMGAAPDHPRPGRRSRVGAAGGARHRGLRRGGRGGARRYRGRRRIVRRGDPRPAALLYPGAMSSLVLGVLAVIVGAVFCFRGAAAMRLVLALWGAFAGLNVGGAAVAAVTGEGYLDRKSTRLNSSHVSISYAVFCLNKK